MHVALRCPPCAHLRRCEPVGNCGGHSSPPPPPGTRRVPRFCDLGFCCRECLSLAVCVTLHAVPGVYCRNTKLPTGTLGLVRDPASVAASGARCDQACGHAALAGGGVLLRSRGVPGLLTPAPALSSRVPIAALRAASHPRPRPQPHGQTLQEARGRLAGDRSLRGQARASVACV